MNPKVNNLFTKLAIDQKKLTNTNAQMLSRIKNTKSEKFLLSIQDTKLSQQKDDIMNSLKYNNKKLLESEKERENRINKIKLKINTEKQKEITSKAFTELKMNVEKYIHRKQACKIRGFENVKTLSLNKLTKSTSKQEIEVQEHLIALEEKYE